jgi:hypothetical protein
MYDICRSFLFLMLGVLAASGQDAPDAAGGARRVRLLCVEAVAGADRLVVMEKSDDRWVARWRLGVSSSFLTDPIRLQSGELALAIDPSPPEPGGGFNGPPIKVEGVLEAVPFQEFKVSASGLTTVLLLANPAAEAAKRPYRVVAMDANPAGFGAGSILVRNFTAAEVAGQFGGKRVRLEPGKSAVVVPGIDQPPGMAQVTVTRAEGDGWTAVFDTRWQAETDYRRYLLLLPRADGSVQPFVMPEHPPFR